MKLLQITASPVWRGHEQKIIYLYEACRDNNTFDDQYIICANNSPIFDVARVAPSHHCSSVRPQVLLVTQQQQYRSFFFSSLGSNPILEMTHDPAALPDFTSVTPQHLIKNTIYCSLYSLYTVHCLHYTISSFI